jgi:hypothetical protein
MNNLFIDIISLLLMNQPFIIKLPSVENKNLDFKDPVVFSSVLPYPLFTLGFHSFIHRTRSAMEITDKLQTKTDFYYVVNPFEQNISNYEDDIKNSTKEYFKDSEKIDLNLWEILFTFDLVDDKTKYEKNDIVDVFKQKFSINGNKEQNLIICSKTIKEDNFIEQTYYKDFITYLIDILENLTEGGNAIVKYYDSFSIPTLKLIYVITSQFKESFIYKPFISRQSDSERFLILKGLRKSKKEILTTLKEILKSMDNENYIYDFFPEITLPRDYIKFFTFVNIRLVNNQQIMINEIVKYIKENNYFGDKYHIFRDKQIEASKWWIRNFYPPSENIYEKNKQELEKLYKATQEKLNLECDKFIIT